MNKAELLNFMNLYAGNETMSAKRNNELESIVDIYLSAGKTIGEMIEPLQNLY